MKAIGIDIGTTTICGVVLDGHTGEVLESKTLKNKSNLEGRQSFERLQDPWIIMEAVDHIYKSFTEKYEDIVSIGLTGQMHGIVYVDCQGKAVSPLYTWQDERGNEIYQDGKTYGEFLSEKTGYTMAAGFGLTTHFYELLNHQVPKEAVSFCTIHQYAALFLTGIATPRISVSDAASFGCFDLENKCFDLSSLEKSGISSTLLPITAEDYEILGKTPQQIPVSIPIGDNQASILGAVQDLEHTILVNVGTGSQISTGIGSLALHKGIELRPCTPSTYLLAGSCLCGGRAFAALEQFFRKVVEMAGGTEPDSLFAQMAQLLSEEMDEKSQLKVDTRFSGTREEPRLTGSITGLNLYNFTPRDFIRGVLDGMAEELYTYYQVMCELKQEKASQMIGSGNGIRLNPHLRHLLEQKFNMTMRIPRHKEEASYGAALVSMTAAGCFRTLEDAQKLIQYE